LLEHPWELAGPPEGFDDVPREDIVLEISGRLMCIERQLVELFTGIRGEWRDGETEDAIDMP
jgi:hypothetical protein